MTERRTTTVTTTIAVTTASSAGSILGVEEGAFSVYREIERKRETGGDAGGMRLQNEESDNFAN